jgi:hypothetical protein
MDLLEIGVNVVDWIGLAQDRYRSVQGFSIKMLQI